MKHSLIISLCLTMFWSQPILLPNAPAQTAPTSIPDPLRFYSKYELVWEAIKRTLVEMQFEIEIEDKNSGSMRTRTVDFSTGTLAPGDLSKFSIPPTLSDGNWVKARYLAEVLVERVSNKEVLFTASAVVQGAKRDFQGNETWITCPTNGTLERRIYSKVGAKLMGSNFSMPEQKKSFWEKGPQPVPSPKTQQSLPKPDRPPPENHR
jgi:hypothetical protein